MLEIKTLSAMRTEEVLNLLQGTYLRQAAVPGQSPAGAPASRPPCHGVIQDPWGHLPSPGVPGENLFLESPGGNICLRLLRMLSRRELSRHMATGNRPNEGGGGGINSHLSPLLL